jgi:hypothetical protein
LVAVYLTSGDPYDRADAPLWLAVDNLNVIDDYCSPG